MLRRLFAAAGLALLAGQATGLPAAVERQAHAAPQRIVSLNLCTDQLLMQMVDRRRITAVTYLARDPLYSGMAQEARRLPVTRGTAEEVIALRPDLVLAGPFSTRETVAILRRLGYEVVSVEPAADFPAIIRNIRLLAQALGEPARGEAMARAIETRLARLGSPAPSAERPVFADYGANGYVSGDGALITSVANAAGFDTLGQRLGVAGARAVSLERLLVEQPDLVALGDRFAGPALATQAFRHPALRRLMHDSARVDVPAHATACGTLLTLAALDALVEARRTLP